MNDNPERTPILPLEIGAHYTILIVRNRQNSKAPIVTHLVSQIQRRLAGLLVPGEAASAAFAIEPEVPGTKRLKLYMVTRSAAPPSPPPPWSMVQDAPVPVGWSVGSLFFFCGVIVGFGVLGLA